MNSDCQGHVARNPSKCAPLIIPSSGEQRCAPRTVVSTSLEKSSLTTVDQSYHPTSSIKHEFSRCRPSNDGSPGLEQQELISSSMPGSTSNTPVDVPRSPPRVLSAGTPPVCTDANAPSANNPINSSAISLAPPTPGHPSSNHAEGRPSPAVSQSSPLRLGQLGPNASHVSQLVSRSPTPTHSGISTPSSISSIKHAPHSPVGRSRAVDTATKDNLTRLSSSLLKHLAEAAAAVGTGRIDDGSGTDAGTENGAVEAKRERFPPPPLGKIDDPVTYGINLGITGELVSSGDVEVWEFPDMTKLKVLRDRLIIFMEENRLKQVRIDSKIFHISQTDCSNFRRIFAVLLDWVLLIFPSWLKIRRSPIFHPDVVLKCIQFCKRFSIRLIERKLHSKISLDWYCYPRQQQERPILGAEELLPSWEPFVEAMRTNPR